MSATKYTYSIAEDFPHAKVDTSRLTQEIQASAIVTALDYINSSGDDCDIWFKDALSVGDETVLDGLVAAHSGEPLPDAVQMVEIHGVEATLQKRFPTAASRPVAPKLTFITPNWCDKTTWYGGSEEVVDEVATDSGDHTTYAVAHQNLIDVYHGKLTFEEQLKDDDGSNYRVRVKVNDVVKTEQDPHYGSGGDYTVNYAAGTVTFLAALDPGDVVKVLYHYAGKATFVVKPTAGKRLYIGTVELQFSDDATMNDSCIFQAYGYVQVFAPQLMLPPYNLPLNTKIPLGNPLVYKAFNDFLNDSNGAYVSYPAFGGSNWRALKKQAYIFAWDYAVGTTCLEAAYGMEIRIDLQHDVPCGGAFGVATLYCTTEDE